MRERYPKEHREPFFAQKFIRLLTKTAAAQEIGPDATLLLCLVAAQEDAKRYRDAVTFWNTQLLPLCGFGSPKRLNNARKAAVDAGWLHYERGGKAKVGRYWVTIPPRFGGVADGPCDEAGAGFLSDTERKAERQNDLAFRSGTANGTTTQNAVPDRTPMRNDKGRTSLPSPIPGRNPDSDQMNERFEKALPLAVRACNALNPKAKNDRQLIARAATLAVTELSEHWFNVALGGVTECPTAKSLAKFRTCCREHARRLESRDFDELERTVTVPKTFYSRLDAALRQGAATGVRFRTLATPDDVNARRQELQRQAREAG